MYAGEECMFVPSLIICGCVQIKEQQIGDYTLRGKSASEVNIDKDFPLTTYLLANKNLHTRRMQNPQDYVTV